MFWGLMVPQSRLIAKEFHELSLTEISKLLTSKIHEIRLIALLILVDQYTKNDKKKVIVNFYLKHSKYINNWDLVDLSAHKILGDWFLDKPTTTLEKLVRSNNLWERRMAVLACFPRIKNNDFALSIKFSKLLLTDKHDLMHKAVGWMLREMGKKSLLPLKKFLDEYASVMPRTMLRYAIERLPEKERKKYLHK
jgi:3-methyladenine DNA glycosylase AlkD